MLVVPIVRVVQIFHQQFLVISSLGQLVAPTR